MIAKAEEKDAPELDRLITREFAYKGLSKDKILERMKRPDIIIFKKSISGRVVGFVEIEFKEKAGMINAISVHEEHRKKGFGMELLEHAVEFMRTSGAEKAVLLVKRENEKAKKLYSKMGFKFAKFYKKVIDDSVVEVWEKHFVERREAYLN